MTSQEWISDENGNRCSVEHFGSEEAAQRVAVIAAIAAIAGLQ